MEKVISCIERICVIRGVNNGIITNEQLQNLFLLFEMNEAQKKKVFSILEKDKIIPIPEREVPQEVSNLHNTYSAKVVTKEFDEQSECESRRKRFEKVLDIYKKDLTDNPILSTRYEEELPIFINAITELKDESYCTPSQKIVKACMHISNYRVREARKRGRVCGTYMSRVEKRFEHWVQMIFSEDELAELIDWCAASKELKLEQMDKIKVLLHNTPKILVHCNMDLIHDN